MLGSGSNLPIALTTDEIVSRVLGGEIDLYEEIIRRFQQDVLRIASALLYHRSATEDVMQQVFLNVYVNLNRFQPGRDFGVWIRTIARNSVREELRKRIRYDRRLKAYGDALEAKLGDNRQADLAEELQEALGECMKQLEESAATAVRLRYVEGKAFSQIAAEVGSTSGAMRNLLMRVRSKLRACVQRRMREM